MENIKEKHWHHHPSNELGQLLDTNLEAGLSSFAVEERLKLYGANRLTATKSTSLFMLFLMQFHQPLVYILLAAALVTFMLNEWVDSGVIFGVVLINAIVGFVQEMKARSAVEALAKSMQGNATVIRENQKRVIAASNLVIGDLVLLQSGDKVPADVRLIQCRELQVDESALTGESMPTQKAVNALEIETALAERNNMTYSSTLVTYGAATGVVVETGDNTEIGQINTLIANADSLATPLTEKIAKFSRLLLIAILALAAITFLIGWLHQLPMLDNFMAAVALAVAAIPEGLPAAISIMLALGVNKMAVQHAIIRKMPAVETLGSTTVICSDKTGTLTQNQMTVQHIFAANEDFEVSGVGYAPQGQIYQHHPATNSVSGSNHVLKNNVALQETLIAGILCNDSRIFSEDNQWKLEGDPTEAALITSALKANLNHQKLEQSHPRLDTLPFESQHQYMASLHKLNEDTDNKSAVIYIKGSVESVLKRSTHAMNVTGELNLLEVDRIFKEIDEMASNGLRVLAFAKKIVPQNTTTINHSSVRICTD